MKVLHKGCLSESKCRGCKDSSVVKGKVSLRKLCQYYKFQNVNDSLKDTKRRWKYNQKILYFSALTTILIAQKSILNLL